jgi:hypothetical protein
VQLDITKPFLCIGRLGTNYLLVQATHRAYRVNVKTHTEDNSGDWLHTKVDIAAGGFRGTFATHLHITDFARFRDELLDLERQPHAPRDDEPQGDIPFGARHAAAFNRSPPRRNLHRDLRGFGRQRKRHAAAFHLKFDRAELPDIVRNLNLMLAEFPLNTEANTQHTRTTT